MNNLTSKEWYLWRKSSDRRYPWDRYLNKDFLKSERKRINETLDWKNNFLHTPYGDILKEVCYYVVPIKIRAGWLKYREHGDYLCKGLSALRNCPVNPIVAFFPPKKVPNDYSLIRIISPKKTVILDGYIKSTIGEYAIEIEDWEKLDSDSIYVDVPFESKILSKIIEENINAETFLAESLQAPLASSPFVLGGIGGISLASILDKSDFAKELCKTMQLMLPPEYRSALPPKSGIRGTNTNIGDGIAIHLAEKIITGKNYLSSVEGLDFKVVDDENRKRFGFQGEYSIVGTMIDSQSKGRQLHKDMLHKFFESEVSIPNLSRLMGDDAYIPNLTKVIDEELWLQIVSMRHKTPPMNISNQEEEKYREKIKKDIDAVLCDMMPEKFGDIIARMKAEKCIGNLEREAKSLARAEGRDIVDVSLLKRARNNFLERFWELENDPLFKNIGYSARVEFEKVRSFNVEMILRKLGKGTAEGIYREVDKNLFKDVEDLKGLLKWLHRKAFVIKLKDEYRWV